MGNAKQKRGEVNTMGDGNRDEKKSEEKEARKSKIRGMALWRDKGGGPKYVLKKDGTVRGWKRERRGGVKEGE